jgi:hypothetical protein
VTAHVDDVVDVLDADRAFAHAGAAGHAVPDHVLAHRVGDERQGGVRPTAPRRRQEVRAVGEDLVAQAHDQELRRQLLAGGEGRTDVLAAPALGARQGVDDLFPGHVGDGGRAEPQVLLGRALFLQGQRLQAAARPGPTEEHVDRCGQDVEVLGVGQVGQEGEDDEDVRPHGGALQDLRTLAVPEPLRDEVRQRRPARRVLVQPQRDAGGVPEQQRAHDAGDQRQDQVGLSRAASLEAPRPLDMADREGGGHARQHQGREDVHEQRVPALVTEPGQRGAAVDGSDHRDQDRGQQHQEAPEDRGVHEARHEPLEQLALPRDQDRLGPQAARHVVEPPGRLSHAHQPVQLEDAAAEQAAADGEDDGQCERARRHAGYVARSLRTSVEIAGTISRRSPITA